MFTWCIIAFINALIFYESIYCAHPVVLDEGHMTPITDELIVVLSHNKLLFDPLSNKISPDSNVHGTNMGPIGGRQKPRWVPCWPHEICYLGPMPYAAIRP